MRCFRNRGGSLTSQLVAACLELGLCSEIDSNRRTIWIADAHRDKKCYVVRAEEKLAAFLELELAIRA